MVVLPAPILQWDLHVRLGCEYLGPITVVTKEAGIYSRFLRCSAAHLEILPADCSPLKNGLAGQASRVGPDNHQPFPKDSCKQGKESQGQDHDNPCSRVKPRSGGDARGNRRDQREFQHENGDDEDAGRDAEEGGDAKTVEPIDASIRGCAASTRCRSASLGPMPDFSGNQAFKVRSKSILAWSQDER